MKKEIHPTYYPQSKITCACGNILLVGSARESIEVEICSACHPFYTGKEKIIDTAGRVEKFKRRVANKKEDVRSHAQKLKEKKAKREEKHT